MDFKRRTMLQAGGLVPLLFGKRLLGAGNPAEWLLSEKPDEIIRIKLKGLDGSEYVRGTMYPVPLKRYLSSEAKKLYTTQVQSTVHEYIECDKHGVGGCHCFRPQTMVEELLYGDSGVCSSIAGVEHKIDSVCTHDCNFTRYCTVVQFMSKRVPLTKAGTVDLSYVKRWAAVLNQLADKKIWFQGTLLRTYYMTLMPPVLDTGNTLLPDSDTACCLRVVNKIQELEKQAKTMPTEAVMLTYPVIHKDYAEDWSGKWLNQKLGYEVFAREGEIVDSTSWDDLPTL